MRCSPRPIFLMMQIRLDDQTLAMDNLGSKGCSPRSSCALISVRVQKFFTDSNLVIKLPESVPPVVYESFLSLTPLFFLVLVFWMIRFVIGVDINAIVQHAFRRWCLLSTLCPAFSCTPSW